MTSALHENESFLRSILDTAVDGIIVINERGAIQSFNRAAERMFGYHAGEVMGKNVSMLMPSPYRENHDQYLARYLSTGEKKIIGIGREVTGQRRNGETFPLELAVSEIRTAGHRAFTGIVRDISERKRAEQQVIQLNRDLAQRAEQLAQANRELESFSYSVSHDLRAPLRHISGYIDMIFDAAPMLDDTTRRYLDIVAASSKRMSALIDDLLEFSRMGRTAMRAGEVDLAHLVSEAIVQLRSECGARQITWRVGDMPTVKGDASMLRAVFANLLGNAVKYTRTREQAVIEIGAEVNENVTVFVRDNGVGFDMRYVAKLFNTFQRLHSSQEFEGTGIGLALVRRIIERHGGKAWAEGEPGRGATFHFSLPAGPATIEEARL